MPKSVEKSRLSPGITVRLGIKISRMPKDMSWISQDRISVSSGISCLGCQSYAATSEISVNSVTALLPSPSTLNKLWH
jgi:hypothetical protein